MLVSKKINWALNTCLNFCILPNTGVMQAGDSKNSPHEPIIFCNKSNHCALDYTPEGMLINVERGMVKKSIHVNSTQKKTCILLEEAVG